MFGERLKLARQRSSLSLRGLADAIDHAVTAQAIGRYERGEMLPGSATALKLAKALNVPLSYLFSPSEIRLEGVEFRKSSATRARERAMVEAAVLDGIDRHLLVEDLLEIGSHVWDKPEGAPFQVADLAELLGQLELAGQVGDDEEQVAQLVFQPRAIGTWQLAAQLARFLLDRLGTPVFPGFLSISDAPHLPRGAGSAPFDADGVATRDRPLVANGRLEGLLLSVYSARRLGMQTTGNAGGAHNVLVSPGTEDLPALLRRMGNGLLVTDLMGFGVNATTGDYSRGAAGFRIEDGAIAHPVEEITIAGNLRDMFLGIQAVGSDEDRHSRIRTGSILIDRMTIAGD